MRLASGLQISVVGLFIFSYTVCQASEAECEAWLRNKIAPRQEVLTRDITVYHWVPCKKVSGYKENGDLAKLATGYVQKQLENTRLTVDNRSGGLYLATDPSSTCKYGVFNMAAPEQAIYASLSDAPVASSLSSSLACLIVIDVPKSTPLLYSPLINLKNEIKTHHADLKRWDCLNDANDKDSGPFAPAQSPLKPLQGVDADYFIDRIYAEQPSLSYDYSAASIPNRSDLKSRALRLRSDILPRLKIRAYEASDLRNPQTDEARNIVMHMELSDAGKCLDANLVPRPSEKDRSSKFSAWLDNVVSQKDFSDVVRDVVMSENSGAKH
ncbi:MAG: hypothetical protein ABIR96_06525 [Bdellovibrionota bacterium]